MSVSTAAPAAEASAFARLRQQAMSAAGAGRYDEARTLLEDALQDPQAPRVDMLRDIAAIALRTGDLVQAIAVARHLVGVNPDDDAAQFTLAMSLAAIGSYGEAQQLFAALNHGSRGLRFHRALPELAALAATEAARLQGLHTPTAGTAPRAAHKYDLSHLTQPPAQSVGGPVQDDEALLLYSVVRTLRLRRILEIGGLSGYSARNFLRAVAWDVDTAVYTVDINPVQSQAPNHFTICRDAALIDAADLHDQPLDLVFFDCHVYDAQMNLYVRLVNRGLIHDRTIIALHDTGLHATKNCDHAYPIREDDGVAGFVHQVVERRMVNVLRQQFGYDAFCANLDVRRNDERLPYRHGITLMKKFSTLST